MASERSCGHILCRTSAEIGSRLCRASGIASRRPDSASVRSFPVIGCRDCSARAGSRDRPHRSGPSAHAAAICIGPPDRSTSGGDTPAGDELLPPTGAAGGPPPPTSCGRGAGCHAGRWRHALCDARIAAVPGRRSNGDNRLCHPVNWTGERDRQVHGSPPHCRRCVPDCRLLPRPPRPPNRAGRRARTTRSTEPGYRLR
jgi:hypothetical protein